MAGKTTELANWIEARRKQLGMSQKDVADAGGFPLSSLAHIISGRTLKPDSDRIIAIAKALQVPPADVFRLVGIEVGTATLPDAAVVTLLGTDEELRDIVREVATLTPELRQQVKAFLRGLQSSS